MRKGTVLYITDAGRIPDDCEDRQIIEQLGLDEKWTVVSAGRDGYHDPGEAALELIVRGARQVEARKVLIEEDGTMRIFGPPLRIS